SLIVGILLNYWVMGRIESFYAVIFLGIGLLYGVGFTLMCMKVKEGDYPPPPSSPFPDKAGSAWTAVCSYFRDGFSNPYYLLFFSTSIFLGTSTVPFNLYSVFYAKSLGMDLDAYFKYIAMMYGISLVIAYPLGVLVDRFHPLRVSLVVLALYGGVMGWGIFYVRNAASFAVVLMLHTVITGTLFTAMASLGQRLLPQAKFAEISSAGSVLNCLFGMAFAPMMGAVLDHTHHEYRYVFHAGLGLALVGLLLGFGLYRGFLALGGPNHYQSPE
ncbi:MAG TPA: MFS transporter, partial [Candidatus Methylacidiphilales bacterium]